MFHIVTIEAIIFMLLILGIAFLDEPLAKVENKAAKAFVRFAKALKSTIRTALNSKKAARTIRSAQKGGVA